MILVEGRVKITAAAPDGRERILNILEPGETFGEMALLDGAPRCADAEAMEPSSAIVVGREAFEELPACDPMVARRGIADLCTRVRKTTAVVEDTLFLSPATRQARRLRAWCSRAVESPMATTGERWRDCPRRNWPTPSGSRAKARTASSGRGRRADWSRCGGEPS